MCGHVCPCVCVCVCMSGSMSVCVCVYQCVLEDSPAKPLMNTVPSSCTITVPSVTLTAASHTNMSNGPPRHNSASSANLLQAFDRISLSTSNMVVASPTPGRRMSLGTLRVNSSQQRQAISSSLFVDGSSLLPRPGAASALDTDTSRHAVASGRSPRVRRKFGKVAGKGKEKPPRVKLSKVVMQTKTPVVDDWLKFDFTSVMSAAAVGAGAGSADVGAGDEGSADEDGGLMAAAVGFVDVTVAASQRIENSELYAEFAQLTKSVDCFTKLAYPDMYGHIVTPFKEAFYEKRFGTQR